MVTYLENVNLAALAQAATSNRRMVLVIRAADGELVDVLGGPIVPAEDPSVPPKGHWYWKDGCVYVVHQNTWKRACAPHMMIVVIQASDGEIIDVLGGPISAAENPNVPPKGHWFWTHNSPGCVTVFHNNVWKRVCD